MPNGFPACLCYSILMSTAHSLGSIHLFRSCLAMKVFSCLQHVVRETHFFLKDCTPGANPAITLLPFPLGESNSFKPKVVPSWTQSWCLAAHLAAGLPIPTSVWNQIFSRNI